MRLALVQARCRVPAEVAAARIEASDAARTGFLKRHFSVRGDEPRLYALVLNMAQMDVATAVDLVCLAAKQKGSAHEAHERDTQLQDAEGCECR